jgi:CxxC motif-containing protein (DUF1111 family)
MRKLPVFMTTSLFASLVICLVGVGHVYATGTESPPRSIKSESLPGGSTTHFKLRGREVFSQPAANMPFKQRLDFALGQSIFNKLWVAAPASTTASDGLGPLYNARACGQCHIREGRGHTPDTDVPDDNTISLLLRLSIPPQSTEQQALLEQGRIGFIPEPTYGSQLQEFAVGGIAAEGRLQVNYSTRIVMLSGGEKVELREPRYQISDPGYGALHPQLMLSPRLAPAMIGLGLLEQIPDATILAMADPDDRDGDGISGRPNRVWDANSQQMRIGRFGWKAGSFSLKQQNSAAFNTDIGISTPDHPNATGDCSLNQPRCAQLPDGNSKHHDGLEASQGMTAALLFYTRHIAVPARRKINSTEVLAGREQFYKAGCNRCHTPSQHTAVDDGFPLLSNQQIWPYTDLLLHDMGEALADNRPEFVANGREWRTPPLWGIGLTQQVSGSTHYLHDGRARTLLEAVLWHGGEAEKAKQHVIVMPPQDRHNLLKFLESL